MITYYEAQLMISGMPSIISEWQPSDYFLIVRKGQPDIPVGIIYDKNIADLLCRELNFQENEKNEETR